MIPVYMKLNQDKCHLLISGININWCGQILFLAKFGKAMIENIFNLALIAIAIILMQCQKADRNLGPLTV